MKELLREFIRFIRRLFLIVAGLYGTYLYLMVIPNLPSAELDSYILIALTSAVFVYKKRTTR